MPSLLSTMLASETRPLPFTDSGLVVISVRIAREPQCAHASGCGPKSGNTFVKVVFSFHVAWASRPSAENPAQRSELKKSRMSCVGPRLGLRAGRPCHTYAALFSKRPSDELPSVHGFCFLAVFCGTFCCKAWRRKFKLGCSSSRSEARKSGGGYQKVSVAQPPYLRLGQPAAAFRPNSLLFGQGRGTAGGGFCENGESRTRSPDACLAAGCLTEGGSRLQQSMEPSALGALGRRECWSSGFSPCRGRACF